MPAQGRSLTGRLLEILGSRWPVAAFLVPVLVAQTLWSGRYEVAGHAADHLQAVAAQAGVGRRRTRTGRSPAREEHGESQLTALIGGSDAAGRDAHRSSLAPTGDLPLRACALSSKIHTPKVTAEGSSRGRSGAERFRERGHEAGPLDEALAR